MYYYQSLFYVTDYIMLCVVLNKMNWTEKIVILHMLIYMRRR